MMQHDDRFQSGFIHRSWTIDNICILYSFIERHKFMQKPHNTCFVDLTKAFDSLYICFVDFTKAFDYVNRSYLFFKLAQYDISGQFMSTLQNMFHKPKNRVRYHGKLSKSFECSYGVLQGGIISLQTLYWSLVRYQVGFTAKSWIIVKWFVVVIPFVCRWLGYFLWYTQWLWHCYSVVVTLLLICRQCSQSMALLGCHRLACINPCSSLVGQTLNTASCP